MDRRKFVACALASVFTARPAFGQSPSMSEVARRVTGVEAEIKRRRSKNSPIAAEWIASSLGEGLSPRERRTAAFQLVQNVPYKLTAWKGDPDSLFSLGRGDCRHKSAALVRLMRAWTFDARPVRVPFDWADLPIPSVVLEPLLETRGIHDSVEVKIDNAFVLVDPTWDPGLALAGFPVLAAWDGKTATLPITSKANIIVRPGDLKAGTDLFAHFGIKWPQRERTLAFNRAFNAWTDEIRSRAKS